MESSAIAPIRTMPAMNTGAREFRMRDGSLCAEARGALEVGAQIVTQAQRECAQQPGRVVSNLMRVSGSADDEEILGIPVLETSRHDAVLRVRTHRCATGDVRGLVGTHVVRTFAA